MTARPKAAALPSVNVYEERARLIELSFRRERDKAVARALSIVFATIAVAVVACLAVEFGRVRALATTLEGCRAAAAQLPAPADRIALITASRTGRHREEGRDA